jgi:hypothetical protein
MLPVQTTAADAPRVEKATMPAPIAVPTRALLKDVI